MSQNITASNTCEANLTGVRLEIDKLIIIVNSLSTTLSVMESISTENLVKIKNI